MTSPIKKACAEALADLPPELDAIFGNLLRTVLADDPAKAAEFASKSVKASTKGFPND